MKKRGVKRHSYHPDPLHWKNLPPGIKILIAYTGIIALFYLLYLLLGGWKPVSIIFGKLIYGPIAVVIELSALILLLSIIYGLIKRHFWVFYVSLIWFSFGIFNAAVSLISFKSEFDVLRSILVLSSFIVIVMNGIIVWYVYSEKYYFKTKHLNKEIKQKDKFFVYLISVFLIVSILLLITYGLNFYNTTIKTTNQVISELKVSSNPDILCSQKTDKERDICYLVLTIINDNQESSLCENIESDFYKITCYRAIQ